MTLMSLESGTWNFYNVCRLFGVPRVYNGRDASLTVLSFQTFFVQAFKIVVDNRKFIMLLLYIL